MNDKTQLEQIMKEMLSSCCELIFKDEVDDIGFELCVNTIITTITYLKGKRNYHPERFCRICKNETVACVCMGEDEAQKQFNQALKSWKPPIRDKNE